MVKAGSIVVALVAILLGGFLALGGALFMLDAGSFFEADAEQRSFLGLFGESQQSASAGTPAWVGLLAALLGGGLLLFGFRALFLTFEGREPA